MLVLCPLGKGAFAGIIFQHGGGRAPGRLCRDRRLPAPARSPAAGRVRIAHAGHRYGGIAGRGPAGRTRLRALVPIATVQRSSEHIVHAPEEV